MKQGRYIITMLPEDISPKNSIIVYNLDNREEAIQKAYSIYKNLPIRNIIKVVDKQNVLDIAVFHRDPIVESIPYIAVNNLSNNNHSK